MIISPIYSVGTKVQVDEVDDTGVIIGLEGDFKAGKSGRILSRVFYFVEFSNGAVLKLSEPKVSDIKEVTPEVTNQLDTFLADSLLLSRESDPERIDATVKELLKSQPTEGDTDEKQHEGLL